MTVKECIKQKGWQQETSTSGSRFMDVDIAFCNQSMLDETEFTIHSFDTNELSKLYEEFCKENKIPKNTVTAVIIVKSYKKYPEEE